MKKMRDIEAVLRKRADKEAAAIFNKIDKMCKQGKSPAKIKATLAADLLAARSKHADKIFLLT